MIGNGMSPARAILAATRNAAELLGARDRVGSIQAGRYADIVALKATPSPTRRVPRRFVMKGGVVYRRGGAPTAAGR